MKKIHCYIRQNREPLNWKVFPWVMETYPTDKGNKILHRRDFKCRNIGECWRLGWAVYGARIDVAYDSAAQRSHRRRWKGIY